MPPMLKHLYYFWSYFTDCNVFLLFSYFQVITSISHLWIRMAPTLSALVSAYSIGLSLRRGMTALTLELLPLHPIIFNLVLVLWKICCIISKEYSSRFAVIILLLSCVVWCHLVISHELALPMLVGNGWSSWYRALSSGYLHLINGIEELLLLLLL